MPLHREQYYRFPWSRTDNPGGWVEVTDECDLSCPGCYRFKLSGHISPDKIKDDILNLKKMINCDGIAIAGGEPLLYPNLLEIVAFITKNRMKSMLLTNGEKLTPEFARDLKHAGLTKFLFHVDCDQGREGWNGKTEAEMNELRQYYADMVYDLRKVHCGFHITVYRKSLKYIPDVIRWFNKNIHKAQHLSLIALRGVPVSNDITYIANGKKINLESMRTSFKDENEINIRSDDIYDIIEQNFPDSNPCAYLNGSPDPFTFKFLIISYIGSKKGIYGTVGAKTIELTQILHHLIKNRYSASVKNLKVGRKIFLCSFFDRQIRRSFAKYLLSLSKNPFSILNQIYVQTINIQQPKEILNGETNLCEGCLNQMIYRDKLINSCRLDEYRLFGGPLIPLLKTDNKEKRRKSKTKTDLED
jgi:organic radical activating enzyme